MFMVSTDRAAHSDFWFQAPSSVAYGQVVTPDSAMRVGTVYACVRVRAETMGTMPLILYRRTANGGKVRAMEHPLYRLVSLKPNPWQTAYEWRSMMQSHLDLRGNAYSRIVFSGALITQLVPMHPDHVKVEWVAERQRLRYRWATPGREETVLGQDEVLHLRGLETDGFHGLNPIEINRRTLAATMATSEYGRRFFENDGTPGGWVEHQTHFKDQESREKWRSSWQEQQAGRNRGRVAVLEYGMKYHEVGVKNTDAQFLETRKANALDICQMFRMPPHKIQILDQAKWANIEQQSIDFVTDTILPSAENWEQRMDDVLLSDAEQGEYFFEYLLDGLLRGDSAARAAYYERALKNRWMVPNEVRGAENLNPTDWGNDPLPLPNESIRPDTEAAAPEPAQDRRAALIEHRTAEAMVNKEVQTLRALAKRPETFAAEASSFYLGEFSGLLQRSLAAEHTRVSAYVGHSLDQVTDAMRGGDLNTMLDAWKHARAATLLEMIHE